MRVPWSMWIASPLPLPACTNEIRMLRTITLETSLMFRPQPVRPELEPTPRIVLFAATRTSSEQLKLPLTRMVCALDEAAAVVSAERLVTVPVAPPAPPVVPPPCVAQPTMPVCGGGLPVVGGVVVGGAVVGGRVVVGGPAVVGGLVTVPVHGTLLSVNAVGTGLDELFQLPLKPNDVLAPVATEPW